MNINLTPYARAIFNIALSNNQTQAWFEKLSDFSVLLAKPLVKNFIQNPSLSSKKKSEIFYDCLVDSGYPVELARFVGILTINNKICFLPEILEIFQFENDKQFGVKRVNIVQAMELPADYREKIKDWLTVHLKGTIVPNWSLDSDLIGGFLVEVGDTVYDYSLRSKLNRIKESLM